MNGDSVKDYLKKLGYPLSEEGGTKTATVKKPSFDWLKTPKFYTPEEAKNFGVEIEEGWQLKLSPADNDMGFLPSLINPQGWEVLQDQTWLSPEGDKYSPEEFEAMLSQSYYPSEKEYAGLPPMTSERYQTEKKAYEFEQVFGQVFPDRDVDELFGWLGESDANIAEFIFDIKEIGRTPETESLLKAMYKDVDEASLSDFFGTTEQIVITEAEEFELDYAPRTDRESQEEIALRSLCFGISDAAVAEFFAMERSRGAVEDWYKRHITTEVEHPWAAPWIDRLVEIRTSEEYKLTFPAEAASAWTAGWGDILSVAGGASRWLGVEGIGDTLRAEGAKLEKIMPPIADLSDFNWVNMFNPRYWTTPEFRAVLLHGVKTVPFALSLLPAAIAGYYGGAVVGGAVAGKLALGSFATKLLTAVFGGIGGAAISRPMESAMEAGGAFDRVLDMGGTVTEAGEIATKIYWDNMKLMGLDAAQMAVALAPLPPSVKIMSKGITRGLFRVARVGGKMVIVGLTEAGEEYYQTSVERRAMGEEDPWIFDAEAQLAAVLGGMMGIGMGAGGDVLSNIMLQTKDSMLPTQREKFEADVLEVGEKDAFDKLAEIPEGAKLVEDIVEVAGEQQLNSEIKNPEKRVHTKETDFLKEQFKIIEEEITKLKEEHRTQSESLETLKEAPAYELTEVQDTIRRIEGFLSELNTKRTELQSKIDTLAVPEAEVAMRAPEVPVEEGVYKAEVGMPEAVTPEVTKGYVYHGTTQGALRKIITEGIKPTSGGQVSVSSTEQYAKTYADRKGGTRGILLRIKDKGQFIPDEKITEAGDYLTRKIISPNDIEVKMPDGSWEPLANVDVTIGVPELKTVPKAEVGMPEAIKPPISEEVTITPKDKVKEQLTEVQKVRQYYQEKIKSYDETKRALVDYVNKHLPLDVRGKMLASVKNVKTEKGLEKAIEQANKYAEQNAQRVLRAEIYKELKRTQAVVKEKILRGKFTAETQRMLDTIRHNLELSRADADAKLVSNFDKYNKGEISWEEMNRENEALNFVGIKEMTSQELVDTLEYIKILREIGKSDRQVKREAYKEKMDDVRADVIDTASGGKGSAKGIYSMPKSEWRANSNWVDKLINWMYNWDSILDKISKFKRDAPFKSKISVFGSDVHRARHMQHHLRKQAQGDAIRGLQEIYKVKKPHQLNRILNGWKHEVITLGEFELAAVEGVEEKIAKTIKMTKGQMMVMYNLMKDPTLDTTFRKTLQWTDAIMGAVRNNLSVEEKAYADWTMDFMKNNRYVGYEAINKVYSDIYGVDLNNNPYYFPAFRDMESQIFEDVLTFREARGYASVLNGSLKVRVSNVRALKFSDITDVMSSHIIRQAHFIAWGQTMRDMRSVFGNREVRETIEQYHGGPIMKEITKNLNDMARDGVDVQTLSHQVNWLRGNFTRSILGVKPSLLLKQIPSFVGYATEMPSSDFVSGVADFWLHPVENYKFMLKHSPYLQERFGVGFERDVHYANVQKPTEFLSGHKPIKSYITENIRFGDKFAVTQGMWAKMQSELKSMGVTRETATEEQIIKALQAAEDVTNRTQPAFDIETLAPLQRGGAWVKLFTMFQTQPAQYFRIIGNNFRNFQYHRGSRAKAISNIVLVWCILPALWQFIADGFQWKEEHQLRAVILGQLNWMLIVSQLAQSSYDWAVGEPFDYQASPVLASVRDFLMGIGKVRKVIGQGQDPYKDISMDDVIGAIEFFGKSAGQVTGYPTPYLIQMEKGLRHYYQDIEKAGEDVEAIEVIKRLIFSEWSLKPPTQSLVDKAQDVADKLGDLIKEVDEVRVEYGLPGEYYGMKVVASRFRDIFKNTLPSEITKENGFNELAVAWAEMEMARQSNADLLPDTPLYKINTDDTEGLTITKLHQLWEARSRLTRLPDIVEFDKTWSDVHIEHGNVTRQQYDLLVKYLETPDEDKKQFVKDHPGLRVNRRDEWLNLNPEDNARLALWGKAKLLSMEAYNHMQKMIDELDIPESGLPEFTLPPEGSVESYFEREEAGKEYGWNSPEARIVLAKDDVLRDWLGLQPVTTPIASLEIQIKWREESDLRDAWGDRESPLYIVDDNARQEAYDKQYENNPDFRDDMRRVEGYGYEFPDDQIDNYVEYYNLPGKGYEQERYLLEHPEFYQSMIDLKDKVPFDEGYKVPDARYDEIYHEWEELFEEYENVTGTESERTLAREAILRDNPEFRKARRRLEAYGKFIPEEHVEDYVGYYEVSPKSSDGWYDNHPSESYYEDDWFLMEHPEFYNVMIDPAILGDDAWSPDARDFTVVPSRDVFKKYKRYKDMESVKSRLWYRCHNEELDDWLVTAKGYTRAYGTDRCLFNQ